MTLDQWLSKSVRREINGITVPSFTRSAPTHDRTSPETRQAVGTITNFEFFSPTLGPRILPHSRSGGSAVPPTGTTAGVTGMRMACQSAWVLWSCGQSKNWKLNHPNLFSSSSKLPTQVRSGCRFDSRPELIDCRFTPREIGISAGPTARQAPLDQEWIHDCRELVVGTFEIRN